MMSLTARALSLCSRGSGIMSTLKKGVVAPVLRADSLQTFGRIICRKLHMTTPTANRNVLTMLNMTPRFSVSSGLRVALNVSSRSKMLAGTTIACGLITRRGFAKAVCQPSQPPLPVSDASQFHKSSSHKDEVPPLDMALLWELVKDDMGLLILAVASALAAAFVNIKISSWLGKLVDVVTGGTAGAISDAALGVLGLSVLQAAFTFGYVSLLSTVGERLCERMRNMLYKSLLYQDIGFFDGAKGGEVIDRLSTDVNAFKSAFKQSVSMGLRNSTQAVGSVISMWFISTELTVFVLVTIPTIIAAGTVFGGFLRTMSLRSKRAQTDAVAMASEVMANIRTVRAFAMESFEEDEFKTLTAQAREYSTTLGLGIGLFSGCATMFSTGVVLSVLYFGGGLVQSGKMVPGELMSFLVSAQTIQRSLQGMSMLLGIAVNASEAGGRAFQYIQLEAGAVSRGDQILQNVQGTIRFENVSFAYPTRKEHPVQTNFDFEIPAGKTVALVGLSGGGKSTIAAMIERFYDPDEGRVTLDGVDIRELDPKWLRGEMIGYINQEPTLWASSVFDNIRYGNPQASSEQVLDAAKRANAHQFITKFPNGYDTVLGERGVTVSGGQRQRIAIARALLKNPRILLLDEATSALDAESEHLVQEALTELTGGRTVLVIAHRLSTVKNADSIAVMEAGKIIEQGTHTELMANPSGVYAALVQHQLNQD
eukprot:m.147295 g.147295  ORF g.147295 m.147295 type:complete len:710 (-) comp30526_c0_seq2:80-2209(-)